MEWIPIKTPKMFLYIYIFFFFLSAILKSLENPLPIFWLTSWTNISHFVILCLKSIQPYILFRFPFVTNWFSYVTSTIVIRRVDLRFSLFPLFPSTRNHPPNIYTLTHPQTHPIPHPDPPSHSYIILYLSTSHSPSARNAVVIHK